MAKNKEDFDKIKFPFFISEQRLKILFEHLSKELPALIEYYGEINGRIGRGRFSNRWNNLEEKVLKSGSFLFTNNVNILSFRLSYDNREERVKYKGIGFDTIPSYSKEELKRTHTANPDDMERVRKAVDKYFVVSQNSYSERNKKHLNE